MQKFLFLVFFVCSFSAQSQSNINTKEPITKFIGVDQFDRLYYLNDHQLIQQSNLTNEYSNIQLGAISSVDISNPNEIIVFYRDFNSIVILDNRLNKIDFVTFNTKNVRFATRAGADQLWIFDSNTNKISRFNYRTLKDEVISEVIRENITHFQSDYNTIFITTESEKLLKYDEFLSLENMQQLDGASFFFGYQYTATITNDLITVNFSDNSTKTKKLNNLNVVDFLIHNKRVIIFNGTKLLGFKLQNFK